MVDIVKSINCPHCSAPLNIDPGNIVVICKYCNSTVYITDTPFVLNHSILKCTNSYEDIEKKFYSWIKNSDLLSFFMKRKIKIVNISLKIVPFWVSNAKIKYKYKGVSLKYGSNVPKEGENNEEIVWKLLARRESYFPEKDYTIPMGDLVQYSISHLPPKSELLNVEITQPEAIELSKTNIKDYELNVLKEEVDDVSTFVCDVSISDMSLVHVPIYFIEFSYKGKSYNSYMDGYSGEIIYIDIPDT
jgi:hypothetical protein